MSDQKQVKDLQKAIIQRARDLAEEHVNQGELIRNRIMHDVHDKVQIMEKKELLSAQENADREFHRLVQANELRMQAELDRNRWGLVQSIMETVRLKVASLNQDKPVYRRILLDLLGCGLAELRQNSVVAHLNADDHQQFASEWDEFTAALDTQVALADEHCECSGGVRVYSSDGDMMVDNTFEGIIARRQDELMRVVFERLFSQVPAIGGSNHG